MLIEEEDELEEKKETIESEHKILDNVILEFNIEISNSVFTLSSYSQNV